MRWFTEISEFEERPKLKLYILFCDNSMKFNINFRTQLNGNTFQTVTRHTTLEKEKNKIYVINAYIKIVLKQDYFLFEKYEN